MDEVRVVLARKFKFFKFSYDDPDSAWREKDFRTNESSQFFHSNC